MNNYSNNNFNEWNQDYNIVPATEPVNISQYVAKVYGWMFLGLCITAGVSWFVATNEAILQLLFSSKFLFFGLFLVQILMVGYLSVRIHKMSSGTATAIFLAYAALTGVTLSGIFLAYTAASLMTVFGITAVTFGIMSAVGYYTKADLTSFGRIMMMGLIGIIIASIVNFFLKSPTLYWVVSYAGVAIFVGLIAYDTQKIKMYALLENEEDRKKGAIMGALALYLDFINLFLMLLRILGRRN